MRTCKTNNLNMLFLIPALFFSSITVSQDMSDKKIDKISSSLVKPDLSNMTVKELLQLQSYIVEKELKKRGVVRTKNNPAGDYAEWLVANALNLELSKNSTAGYDAIDDRGVRYQIKGRRITPDNSSRQLGVIRNLEEKKFDKLAAIIFNDNYSIVDAIIIPHSTIDKYASYKKHVNGHILHMRGAILKDPMVIHFKNSIKQYE